VVIDEVTVPRYETAFHQPLPRLSENGAALVANEEDKALRLPPDTLDLTRG